MTGGKKMTQWGALEEEFDTQTLKVSCYKDTDVRIMLTFHRFKYFITKVVSGTKAETKSRKKAVLLVPSLGHLPCSPLSRQSGLQGRPRVMQAKLFTAHFSVSAEQSAVS